MKDELRRLIAEYFRQEHPTFLAEAGGGDEDLARIKLEPPRDPAHGDLACNIALAAAASVKKKPREIAEDLAARMNERLSGRAQVEVAGPGFLNFRFSAGQVQEILRRVLSAGEDFGRSEMGRGERVNLEFVSANPTGPPVIVSARAAAFGSTLARILAFAGYEVTSEYYFNNAGTQVQLLGESLRARWRELQGAPLELPENGYHGLYLREMAAAMDPEQARAWEALPEADARDRFSRHAVEALEGQVRREMERFRTPFDVWYPEASLHESGKLDAVLALFEEKQLLYERDGARWFRSSDYGDDKDRVLVRSDGRPTYFCADAAYHLDKLERGFDRAVVVLGPDHHGHVARMQAIAQAIGAPPGWLEILLLQWVTLMDGGEPVAMSKRTGEFITMADLIDDVGVDVARTYFLTRRRDSHLDFDLVQAREQSSKSRVFYAQYATARIAGVLRKAAAEGLKLWADEDLRLTRLETAEELDLIKLLEQFGSIVQSAARSREPNRIFNYLVDVATQFHRFYHERQIVSSDEALSQARLALCRATRQVFHNGLGLIGVEAPERM